MQNNNNNSFQNENYQRFRKLFEQMSAGLVICSLEGIFIDVNEPFCNITGYSKEELGKMTFKDITFPEDLNQDLENVKQLIEGKIENYTIEKRYIRKDKSVIWVKLYVSAIIEENEFPTYLIGSVVDITEQKKAQDKLLKSESQFRALFEQASDGIFISDAKGNYTNVNTAGCEMMGYSLEEITKLTIADIITEEEVLKLPGEIETLIKDGIHRAEWKFKRKDNSVLIGDTVVKTLSDGRFQAFVRDITERKKNEDILKKTKSLLDEMGQVAKIGGWEFDVNTLKGTWTQEVALIHDLSPDEETNVEMGLSFYVNDSRAKIEMAVKEAIEYGLPYELELELITAKGNHKWVRTIGQVEKQNNKVVRVYGSFQDVTDRVLIKKELINAKEKAEESDRLKTAFLQNMSHEIRTPLNAIMGFSDLLTTNFDNKEKLKYFTDIIQKRGGDLLEIINDILDIAKIESGQLTIHLEKCQLNDLFTEMEMFFNEYRKRINKPHVGFNLNLHCMVLDKPLIIDKVKLKQILINLISNAFKFTHNGTIEIGCDIIENNTLSFYVADTGIGIPKEKQSEIFERFMQANTDTSTLYGGTGLGLSIVKGLLNLIDGKIWVESEPGKGSTFHFTLPYIIAESATEEPLQNIENKSLPDTEITILIVEDDLYNAEYLKEVLSETKYTILHSEYGKKAVEIATNQDIDVILMDIRLPDITGYEAFRLIKKQKPNIKIIAQTAYATLSDKQKALDFGFDSYISKPISKNNLFELLKQLLNKQ